MDHSKDRCIPGYDFFSYLRLARGDEGTRFVTDTIAAARRQASPIKKRIVVRRATGFGEERRRKNQSEELSAPEGSCVLPRDPYSREASRTMMKGRP